MTSPIPSSYSSSGINASVNSSTAEMSTPIQQASIASSAVTSPTSEKPQTIKPDELTNGYIDRVVALYEFKPDAATPGAIGFPKDAIINIIDKPSDWWFGEYNGSVGILPYNYVKSIVKGSG